jgi:hypothetical protein
VNSPDDIWVMTSSANAFFRQTVNWLATASSYAEFKVREVWNFDAG